MALLVPEYLQTKTYAAIRDRYALHPHLQEGVVAAQDLEVTQRGAGANMSVDIAAGRTFVQGDAVARQGLYHVVNDAVINATIAANASGNPRIDQIICRAYDSTDAAQGTDIPAIEVLTGTATAGATLDNRTGAAALPSTAVRLADVLVANGAASITNSVIRDRRPWARGAFSRLVRTAGDLTTTSATPVEMSSALRQRIECVGNPVRVTLRGQHYNTTLGQALTFEPRVDGALESAATTARNQNTASYMEIISAQFVLLPAAGSHVFSWYWATTGGTLTMEADGVRRIEVIVEELVRQNYANNTVTSG